MRAAQAAKEKKAAKPTINPDYAAVKNAKKITFLKKERAQLMRDMEQEAEPEGGPIADEYGRKLDKIDTAIAKLSGRKEMTYDQAVGKVNEQMDIYDDIANEEFGMDYDQLGSNEQQWVHDEIDNMPIKEAKKDIYDKFLENPTSPKGRAKAIISKFKKKYGEDATEMAVDRFSKQNNLKPEEKYILKYITKNDIKITSQPGGPNLSAVNEAKATCCHRCGRVHVKGSGCKKPYLKGKDSCAINEIETLKEFFNK